MHPAEQPPLGPPKLLGVRPRLLILVVIPESDIRWQVQVPGSRCKAISGMRDGYSGKPFSLIRGSLTLYLVGSGGRRGRRKERSGPDRIPRVLAAASPCSSALCRIRCRVATTPTAAFYSCR